MQERWHLLISGKVQGVGYRASTQITARALGLTGTVRNLSDGRVEIWAEGETEQLRNLKAWCGKGPVLSVVDQVDLDRHQPSGTDSDFRIV